MFRRRRTPEPAAPGPAGAAAGGGEAPDLSTVPPRLLRTVSDAFEAQRRWHELVGTMAPGPLADRMRQLGGRVDAGVADVHATAVRVGEVERVLSTLDPDGAASAYKAAKRQASEGNPPPELEALEARFTSVQRILNTSADAEDKLRVLDARLLAAVARAAEVALTADVGTLQSLDDDLDLVVSELGALRTALTSLA